MKIHSYTLNEPQVSIICGYTAARYHMLDRAIADMQAQMYDLPVEFISVEWELDDGPWREGVAKNAGAYNASSDRCIFTNCDITIPRRMVEIVLGNRADFPWYISGLRFDEDERFGLAPNPHALGDFQAVSRPMFDATHGFNNRMSGWGYVDIDFHERARRSGQAVQLSEIRCRHNWHPRYMTDAEYRASNARNKQLV